MYKTLITLSTYQDATLHSSDARLLERNDVAIGLIIQVGVKTCGEASHA